MNGYWERVDFAKRIKELKRFVPKAQDMDREKEIKLNSELDVEECDATEVK